MAEERTGPVETGAEMDYQAHEKTFSGFLTGTKYLILIVAAVLVAMAAGFFGNAGFFGALILFVLICVGGYFLLR